MEFLSTMLNIKWISPFLIIADSKHCLGYCINFLDILARNSRIDDRDQIGEQQRHSLELMENWCCMNKAVAAKCIKLDIMT